MSHFGRSGPPDITDTYSLLCLNISFRTSADDLFPLFDKCGKVVDIFIPRDRRTGDSRGFAFVRYKYAEEAQKAVDRIDGRTVDGREIAVQFAKYGPNAERIYKGRIVEPLSQTRGRSRSRSPRKHRYDERDRDNYRKRSRSKSHDRHDRHRHCDREKASHRRSRSQSRTPDHYRERERRGRSYSRSYTPESDYHRERGTKESRRSSRSYSPESDYDKERGTKKSRSYSRSYSPERPKEHEIFRAGEDGDRRSCSLPRSVSPSERSRSPVRRESSPQCQKSRSASPERLNHDLRSPARGDSMENGNPGSRSVSPGNFYEE